MANIKSKEKNIKRIAKSTEKNRAIKSSVRTAIKKAKLAANENDQNLKLAISNAHKELDKAVSKGVLKQNNASRRASRLDTYIKKTIAAK